MLTGILRLASEWGWYVVVVALLVLAVVELRSMRRELKKAEARAQEDRQTFEARAREDRQAIEARAAAAEARATKDREALEARAKEDRQAFEARAREDRLQNEREHASLFNEVSAVKATVARIEGHLLGPKRSDEAVDGD